MLLRLPSRLDSPLGDWGVLRLVVTTGNLLIYPWAVQFTSEYAHKYVGVPVNIPLHPSQLYESLTTFCLFLVLLWRSSQKSFTGQVFLFYLFFYGVARFGLEFFRGDVDRGFVFGGFLSTSQFISLMILAMSVFGYFFRHSRPVESNRA